MPRQPREPQPTSERRRNPPPGDPQHRKLILSVAAILAVAVVAFLLIVPKWDRPPIVSAEYGPDALAMNTFTPLSRAPNPLNTLAFPIPEPVADRGVSAGEAYGNVEVLADLDAAQFDRLMVAITEWVAPNDGCTFCHAAAANGLPDYEAPPPYTFAVARQMLRMTRDLNVAPEQHLQPQGVTCFSCHRGQNVPEYHWFKAGDWPPPSERWFQEPPPWIRTATTIRGFFPREAFEMFLLEDNRAAGIQARDVDEPAVTVMDPGGKPLFTWAENIYILMMQMSDGLGVNCTACHNSRAFADWSQSTPQRIAAWYAIHQTQMINHDYIEPLAPILPDALKGPVGDPAKVECMTCHVAQTKPLGGIPMVAHFPGLIGAAPR